MEKLVQSVFSDFFDCEVTHVGRSGDGGIDLILVNSDSPVVVQVRRRKKLKITEGVRYIREFLGAALVNKNKNLIYVSTCSKFSDKAEEAALAYVDNGQVESYKLYDFERFRDVLKLTVACDKSPTWQKHITLLSIK